MVPIINIKLVYRMSFLATDTRLCILLHTWLVGAVLLSDNIVCSLVDIRVIPYGYEQQFNIPHVG